MRGQTRLCFHLLSNFLVNSADRVIRVFDLDSIMEAEKEDDLEPLQKLQDLVNRWVWLHPPIFAISPPL